MIAFYIDNPLKMLMKTHSRVFIRGKLPIKVKTIYFLLRCKYAF